MIDKAVTKQVNLVLPKAHPKQHEFITILDRMPEVRFAVGACGTKLGKATLLSEPIPTIDGWKTMGDIKEGDYVFDIDGKPTLVEYTTDPMYGRKCYEVVFSDGSVVKVDAEHLWETQTHNCRKNTARVISDVTGRNKSTTSKAEVRSTEEIKNTLTVKVGSKTRPNHSVDVCGQVEFPEKSLPLDPYVLGVWLGDGSTSAGSVAGIDEEIFEELDKAGYPSRLAVGAPQLRIVKGLADRLRDIGVFKNKHVPAQYMVGSVEQRLSLLQGLMDTDGYVDAKGHCFFYNTNKLLADAAQELAQSLGVKVIREEKIGRLYGVEHKLCYIVYFTTDLPVFRLPRKLARLRPVSLKTKKRYIVAINDIPSEPVKCIRVASPRHLFLVSKAYIPTHNTFGCCIAMVKYAWNTKNSISWWGAPTYVQSKNAYNLIKQLLPKDTYNDYKADLVIEILEPDGTVRSKIEFKSADNPDNMRGFGVNFFVADEAARWPYDSIVSLITTLTQTRGRGFFISTPMGRGKFYEMYMLGLKVDDDGNQIVAPEDDEYPEWYSMRLPTWVNPHVKMEAIMEMKRALPDDVFQQEVEAQFLLDSAGVFRGTDGCVKGTLVPPIRGKQYVMGVDLARLKDYSVLTVVDKETRHVVYFDRFNKISWEVQYHKIIEAAKRYRARVCIDSTGIGDPIVEALSRAGLDLMPYKIHSSATKQQLIDKLRVAIENQTISFPNIPALVKEMKSYEYTVAGNGIVKFSAPSGGHDDCVISLALANWAADSAPFIYRYTSLRGI